jgi:hypothetical protein
MILGLLMSAAIALHFFGNFLEALLAGKLSIRDIVKLSTAYVLCSLTAACLMGAGQSTYVGEFGRAGTLCFALVLLLFLAYMAIVV